MRIAEEVCHGCGYGPLFCDCGGFDDETVKQEEDDEVDGYGGGAVDTWLSAAMAFQSDDDEDPLADDEPVNFSSPQKWTPPGTQYPTNRKRAAAKPKLIGSIPVDAPTISTRRAPRKTSAYAAPSISITKGSYAEFRRFSPSTVPMLNTSGAIRSMSQNAVSEMPFYDWVRSIGKLTQRWDNPVNYIAGRKIHGGTDIAKLPIGAPITAFRSGRVVELKGTASDTAGWGLTIVLEDAEGRKHRYAHLLEALVGMGQDVQAGELVGRMGRSGTVFGKTGVHLHYEIKDKFGTLVDPETI